MPKSIKKNDIFGKEYIQHYDDNYNEIGTSVVKENFTGIKYIQHYDTNGNETGRSEFIENWFGEEYLQHFDTNFQETGHSKEKESFLGDKYTEHYDNDYNVTGQTKNKEGFFGDKYRETTLRSQQPKNNDSESSVGFLLGMFVRMFGVEKGLMYYRILFLSFWGGIIYIVITMILPLFIINISIIGLIIGLLKRERTKFIFLISVVGMIFLIFDYNNGWLTKFLIEHSPSFNNKIGFFLYSNIIAGLVSAYFFIRNILNEKKPDEIAEGEFSKRNLVIMGSLLLVGCLTIGGQKYYESKQLDFSKLPTKELNTTIDKVASPSMIAYVKTKEGTGLRLRKDSFETGAIMTIIPDKTAIILLDYDENNKKVENWSKVEYNGLTGWAWSEFIVKDLKRTNIVNEIKSNNVNSNQNKDTENAKISTSEINITENGIQNSGNTVENKIQNLKPNEKLKRFKWITCNYCNGGGHLTTKSTCNACDGAGSHTCRNCNGQKSLQCPKCFGDKKFICDNCNGQKHLVCPKCNGSKKLNNKPCYSCGAKGFNHCYKCGSAGFTRCAYCAQKGTIGCNNCNRTGKLRCNTCNSIGVISTKQECQNCIGSGKLQVEIQ